VDVPVHEVDVEAVEVHAFQGGAEGGFGGGGGEVGGAVGDDVPGWWR